MSRLALGLVGDDIRASQAPRLHVLAGRLLGREVSYELLVPNDLRLDFAGTLDTARARGLSGINVTHPYKEQVVAHLRVDAPRIRRLGAVNTVLFTAAGPLGFNTDYTGFIAAWRRGFGDATPGEVAVVGAGGAGKATAFALGELGAVEIRVVDLDRARATRLAAALGAAGVRARACAAPDEALAGATGVVNATPLGMTGRAGSAVPGALLRGLRWAFDAVYTPVATTFLADAAAAGAEPMSGWQLFFYQGLHAVELFHGRGVDEDALRRALRAPG